MTGLCGKRERERARVQKPAKEGKREEREKMERKGRENVYKYP